jgi:hypothetical protein
MDSLSDLLHSARGRSFLEARGVLADPDDFRELLRPPSRHGLSLLLGLEPGAPLVYVGQQVCCDYRDSVKRKFLAARELASDDGASVGVLWHDMDRAGSDELSMRILLPLAVSHTSIRLAPRSLREKEARFIGIEQPDLEEALRRIGAWIGQGLPKARRPAARSRLSRLEGALLGARIETLAEANRALSSFLLHEHLAFAAPAALVSEVASQHLLTETINDCLGNMDDFIAVLNEAIEDLIAHDVDPQVRPLPSDYLPLRYSCPQDGFRLRLTREEGGDDQFAIGTCRCGIRYRFHLGGPSPALGELEATGRWSPDISLPIYLNDLASGFVAGRSSALYGMVLNEALARVLGRRPIPVLVPPEVPGGGTERQAEGSLLYEYLAG